MKVDVIIVSWEKSPRTRRAMNLYEVERIVKSE